MANNNPMGLYIHLPFCSKKCDYCDFTSYTMGEDAQKEYIDAVCEEIELRKREFNDCTFDTIYLGGGTPSVLDAELISKLTKKIYSSFHFDDYVEYTIEVNPMSFTRSKFLEYVKCGINRISVGVQCLDERVLKRVGRIQTNKSVYDAFKLFNDSAFLNYSADIMIGLPGQTKAAVKRTLDFLLDEDVKHISIYTLQVEKGTKLCNEVNAKRLKVLSDKKQVKMYDFVCKYLAENGFIRYELSNFCVPGYDSLHNQKYWDETEYVGIGLAAHSYIDGYRYENVKDFKEYLAKCKAGQLPVATREYISNEKRRTERIMLSLRTYHGLDLERFKQDFNEDILRSKAEQIKQLTNLNMVKIVKNHLRIVPDKMSVSNSIIVELL